MDPGSARLPPLGRDDGGVGQATGAATFLPPAQEHYPQGLSAERKQTVAGIPVPS